MHDERRENYLSAYLFLFVCVAPTPAYSFARTPATSGVGPVIAARIIGRTGTATRFPTAAAYANNTGVAPADIASADSVRHRWSRYGDRELNSALHTIAMIQIRMRTSVGHVYYDKKIAEGKSPKEARRCLKRRLADLCWRTMIRDERRTAAMRGRKEFGQRCLVFQAAWFRSNHADSNSFGVW
ncbi:IS110 family transposase [Nocardia sp. SYP-A9097]|uniref:IS110 family transposase n=1 Tax=Nocardia sp. SYP-A9097 TaxID=2663237 RepID=UPI001E3DDE64|nr:IS110 family transposase [Nocardia sp. SYP-A9097]